MNSKQATPAKKGVLRVKMVASICKASKVQVACMRGLGLKKIGQLRELEDTDAVRGMVRKVSHLVSIVG